MFQSTHSLWSATVLDLSARAPPLVSIHALLVECDLRVDRKRLLVTGFNPRTPCGVRLQQPFQHPAKSHVSIHALLVECDLQSVPAGLPTHRFNPRTPCGVRQEKSIQSGNAGSFNPRTPCGVRLISASNDETPLMVSIHALLVECDCARPYTLLLNRANHTLRQPP